MGGLSALIVSPCVAAPLAGALLYISQTRDVCSAAPRCSRWRSGMSVPLLLVGVSAGALLPRAGAWMDEVKHVFGVLLLGVALWIVQPVLPGSLRWRCWGALALGAAAMAGLADGAFAGDERGTRDASTCCRGARGACGGRAAGAGRRAADRRRGLGRPIRCSRWRACRARSERAGAGRRAAFHRACAASPSSTPR